MDNYIQLPIRHRFGFVPEESHLHDHLTEPGLVTPLEKILRSQAQNMPVPFLAGSYLDKDYSVIDGLDRLELFEFRQDLEKQLLDIEEQFHVASVKLSKMSPKNDSNVTTDDQNPKSDPNPTSKKIVDPTASNEAKSESAKP